LATRQRTITSGGDTYKLYLPSLLSQGHDSSAPFWTGGAFGIADENAVGASMDYLIGFEDKVRMKWFPGDSKLLDFVGDVGGLLFTLYGQRGINPKRLFWAQYSNPHLRVLLNNELPSDPDRFIDLLEHGKWFDRWVMERRGPEEDIRQTAANKVFTESNALPSFNAFRKELRRLCDQFNKSAETRRMAAELDRRAILETESRGEISYRGRSCVIEFTGLDMGEQTMIRLHFRNLARTKTSVPTVEFTPEVDEGRIVWASPPFKETPESLAGYCLKVLLEEKQESVSREAAQKKLFGFSFNNVLSFAPNSKYVRLKELNVLVGTNGSGKSNVIEVFSLLSTIPSGHDGEYISKNGGIEQWLWRGPDSSEDAAFIAVTLGSEAEELLYEIRFKNESNRPQIVFEAVRAHARNERGDTLVFRRDRDTAAFYVGEIEKPIAPGKFNFKKSVIAQFSDPELYPQLWVIKNFLESIRFYRNPGIGTNSPLDYPQLADLPNDALSENFENLGVVLQRILANDQVRQKFTELLQDFYEDTKDIRSQVSGGRIDIFIAERHLQQATPMIRLSDGTVKWICLLAILLDPDQPPVIFLEEPEVGLHPDILPMLAKLLLETSKRTQLVVTTHSDILIDAFSDEPENVLVCEKVSGSSRFSQFSSEQLAEWLAKYRLGEIWRSGRIGGTRW
jgi:predicted ATPase